MESHPVQPLESQPRLAVLKSFKALLKRKLGSDSGVFKAIESIKKRPESDARKAVLVEEIADSGVDKDEEMIAVAEQLLKLLEAHQTRIVYKAELKGSGAIGQDGAVTAGTKSIAAGSISTEAEQNIINGSNNLVADIIFVDVCGYEKDKALWQSLGMGI